MRILFVRSDGGLYCSFPKSSLGLNEATLSQPFFFERFLQNIITCHVHRMHITNWMRGKKLSLPTKAAFTGKGPKVVIGSASVTVMPDARSLGKGPRFLPQRPHLLAGMEKAWTFSD